MSTHPLMPPSTSPKEALFACPPFPPWNLPSFTVESTPSSPCSRSNPSLPRQGADLARLDSLPLHDLALWTDRSVPSPLGKDSSGILANCSLCGTEATLSFSAGPVCSSFSTVPFCTLFAGLCSTNKPATPLLIFFYLTFVLSLPLCTFLRLSSYLKLCGRSGRNCLLSPPVLSGYNWSPDNRVSRETMRLMSWPNRKCYLHPLQSLAVFLLFSLVSILVFSWTGGVLSHLNSSTCRFSRFPLRNLCSLVKLAVFSLIYTAMDTALELLSSYLSRIGRIENPSCSTCGHSSRDTSHLILHCSAMDSMCRLLFGDSLSLYNL